MTATGFTIGHLARETGCKIATIRYCEQIGLMPLPVRTPGNTRIYGPAHVARLDVIRHCRDLGLSQADIRELLDLTERPDMPCKAVTEIARAHLDAVNERMTRLAALKSELERMIKACSGGRVEHCRIVQALADRSPVRNPGSEQEKSLTS